MLPSSTSNGDPPATLSHPQKAFASFAQPHRRKNSFPDAPGLWNLKNLAAQSIFCSSSNSSQGSNSTAWVACVRHHLRYFACNSGEPILRLPSFASARSG